MDRSRALLLALLSGCAAVALPPPDAGTELAAQELLLLAFAADGVGFVAIERTVAEEERFTLWAYDLGRREQRLVGAGDERLRAALAAVWPSPRQVIDAVRRHRAGRELVALGYAWAEPVPSQPIGTDFGELRREEYSLVLSDDELTVPVAALVPRPPTEEIFWLSVDGRRAAWGAAYPGRPTVRDLRVIDLPAAAATLLSTRAFAAHEAEEYDRAIAFWTDALAFDPGAVGAAYNIACAQAKAGRTDDALLWLAHAISRGGPRVRRLAEHDPDLTALRHLSRFRALTAATRSNAGVDPASPFSLPLAPRRPTPRD